MRVLGIIPARGGSQGVARKNVKELCGKPLLAYTVESALRSNRLNRTILSTEDSEIANMGRELGVDVPFMRPVELASDSAPTFPVVLHAVTELEKQNEFYDAVCLLQPTNPLRRSEDIDGCIELLERSGADSVITILPVPHEFNPKWVYWQTVDGELRLSTGDEEPVMRRQDLPEAFHREGSVYVTRRDVLFEFGNLYGSKVLGYRVDVENSVNIDSPADWESAEAILAGRADETSGSYAKF